MINKWQLLLSLDFLFLSLYSSMQHPAGKKLAFEKNVHNVDMDILVERCENYFHLGGGGRMMCIPIILKVHALHWFCG